MGKEKCESCLEELKKKYEKLQKQYSLPSFEKLNEEFDIEKIAENETDFLLREVRKGQAAYRRIEYERKNQYQRDGRDKNFFHLYPFFIRINREYKGINLKNFSFSNDFHPR